MLFTIKPFYERWWGKNTYLITRFSRSRESVWVLGGTKCIPVGVGTVKVVRFP